MRIRKFFKSLFIEKKHWYEIFEQHYTKSSWGKQILSYVMKVNYKYKILSYMSSTFYKSSILIKRDFPPYCLDTLIL